MIWTNRYYEPGDFELYLPANEESMQLYSKIVKTNHYYLIPDIDLATASLKDCMVITNLESVTDKSSGNHLIITGKSLKSILGQRIAWGRTNLTGRLDDCVRQIVNDNAIAPAISDRRLPNLIFGETSGIDDTVSIQTSGETLDKLLEKMCKPFNVGWDVKLDLINKKFIFQLYKGTNRSYSQLGPVDNHNPYIVFSAMFDNILSTKYTVNTTNYKNIAYVEALYLETDQETKKTEKKDYSQTVLSKTVTKNPTWYDRYELYVDGSGIDVQYAAEPGVYGYLLRDKGKAEIKKYDNASEISGKVVPNLTYKINQDYFLGDLVTVVNEYGQKFDARVTEVTTSESVRKYSVVPTFTIEHWDESKDEDKPIDDKYYRCCQDGPDTFGEYRVTEDGVARIKDRGYKIRDRITEDGVLRETEIDPRTGKSDQRKCLIYDNYKGELKVEGDDD
jgi:hypothetical protein